MRITGGALRGREVAAKVPAGVRPTSARVREALFSMVGQRLQGRSVLDAFGGTGMLGIEAVSRGAHPVLIIEQDRASARRIERQLRALGARARVRCADAERVLKEGRVWDIVLLDPPYAADVQRWALRAAPAVAEVLVVEHASRELPPTDLGPLILDRRRRYGDTTLSVYRPREDATPTELPPASVRTDDGVRMPFAEARPDPARGEE